LKDLATREVVIKYLAGIDLNDVLSQGRLEAAQTLRDRIQNSANARSLGAKIIFVGLQDIHPPTASDVAATTKKLSARSRTARHDFECAASRRHPHKRRGRRAGVHDHQCRRCQTRQLVSRSLPKAALFTNQIPAFAAAPSVYRQRLYLQSFAAATGQCAQIHFARHQHAGRGDF
jgi:hypothetical protein